jgi:hypothetical protein
MDIIEKAIRAGKIAEQIKNLTAELESLFGGAPMDVPSSVEPTPAPAVTPEPAPAVEAPRRGRPPGSTNKPKVAPVAATSAQVSTPTAETPTVNHEIPWGGDDGKPEDPPASATTPTEDPGF